MVDIIPMRFYGFDTVIYLISAVICLLIAYKAYKLHAFSGKKQHFYLATAFTILGVALATLTLTTGFTYYGMLYTGAGEHFFDQIFYIDDLGFWIYYVASMLAYVFLVLMYIPEHKTKFAPLLFFSTRYFEYFNIVLFFLMAYVAFQAARNYFTNKSGPALLVMGAFLLIAAYHAILPFAAFSKVAYVVAHGAQIAGYGSLLLMLFSTGKK